jgi:hypothetical protein
VLIDTDPGHSSRDKCKVVWVATAFERLGLSSYHVDWLIECSCDLQYARDVAVAVTAAIEVGIYWPRKGAMSFK